MSKSEDDDWFVIFSFKHSLFSALHDLLWLIAPIFLGWFQTTNLMRFDSMGDDGNQKSYNFMI